MRGQLRREQSRSTNLERLCRRQKHVLHRKIVRFPRDAAIECLAFGDFPARNSVWTVTFSLSLCWFELRHSFFGYINLQYREPGSKCELQSVRSSSVGFDDQPLGPRELWIE